MVPLRFVSEALGADVKWDQNSFTASISSPTGNGTNNAKAIEALKFYSEVSNHYKDLLTIGDMLTDFSSGLSLAYNEIERSNKKEFLDKLNNKNINEIIDIYNSDLEYTNKLINRAKSYNVDISNMNGILSNYYDSIEYHKLALDHLYEFYNGRTNSSFNLYLNNSSNGFDIAFEGKEIAQNSYFDFYKKIQQY